VTVACGRVPTAHTAASAEERSRIEADRKVMDRSVVVPLGQEPLRHTRVFGEEEGDGTEGEIAA
jgi:hypothetical protein